MSVKEHIIQLQKTRINGPFQKVTYIDPFPDDVLQAPSSRLSKCLILLGILSIVLIPVFGIVGQMTSSEDIANPIVAKVVHGLLWLLNEISKLFTVEQLAAAMIVIGCCMAIFATSIVASNIATKRAVLTLWQSRAHSLEADIVESEVQSLLVPRSVKRNGRTQFKKVWDYRLQVAFTYNGIRYEATPSVVNRLAPGAQAKHFESEAACRQEVDNYHGKIKIELNPSNPLDCEIAGRLKSLYRKSFTGVIFLGIFVMAIVGMTSLAIFLIQNGHSYRRP